MNWGGSNLKLAALHTAQPEPGGFYVSGDIVQPLVSGKQSTSEVSLSRVTILPGTGQMLHRHAQHETLFVLEGQVRLTSVRGRTFRNFAAGPGALLHVPGCVPHMYFNDSSEPAVLLTFSTPAGLEGFYARAGQKVADVESANCLSYDVDHIEGVGWQFGIEPIDPELFDSREGYRASGAHFCAPEAGQRYDLLGSLLRIVVDGSQSESWLTVLERTQGAGAQSPLIRHAGSGTYFVLEGSFEFVAYGDNGPQRLTAKAGSAVYRPAGMLHAFYNNAATSSRLLSFLTPAGIENFIRTVAREVAPGEPDGHGDVTPDELERVSALGTQFGVEIKPEG